MNSDITAFIFFSKKILKKGISFKIPVNCKSTSIEISVPTELGTYVSINDVPFAGPVKINTLCEFG
jgi:hypothetical protein